MEIDTLPYKTFQRLKEKYPTKMILVTDGDMIAPGVHQSFKNHRDYIQYRFLQEGIVITRWNHDYKSLDTSEPKLGLVYQVNDSVINEGIEVWALMGHNAKLKGE